MKKEKKQITILGAGITGLVTAYYFSQDPNFEVTLIEKNKYIGGTAMAFKHKDFTLDYGPHKLYTVLPGIIDEIKKVTPLLKIKKTNSIYLKNNFFDFPLKISQIAQKMPFTAVNSGIDIFTKSLKKLPDDSYENFLLNRFGKTLYELSFKDYATKVWGTPPQELDRVLAIKRVSISNIFELIKGILFKDTKKISAEYFYYPPKGIMQLLDNLAEKIKENGGKILLEKQVSEVKTKDNKIEYIKVGKKKIKTDYLISTIYLNDLLELIQSKEKLNDLNYQDLNVLYLILNKKRALKDCWIFFPEKKFLFHRLSEQKAFSPETSPEDKTALMVETTKELNQENINIIIKQLISIGILKKDEIQESFVKSLAKVYPIYKKGFLRNLIPLIKKAEAIENIYTIGRPGLFNYNNMDQCWDMAKKTFEHIKQEKTKQDWQKTKKYFDNYKIVD
jgi:protoporphyrinogen oxidase